MSSCRLEARDKGVFVLTMASNNGHNYLTEETITDLLKNLDKIRNNAEVKGLVTTCDSETGTFCDGLDYDHQTEVQAGRLAKRVARVIRRLLELPIPTVAAVRGRATSLGLALVLAHDHCVVWEDALFGLPEAQRGYPLPDFLMTLMREKLSYARLQKLRMAKSQGCHQEPARTPWCAHGTEGDRKMVLNKAIHLLNGIEFLDGTTVTKNRQMQCPETCAAVGVSQAKQIRTSVEETKGMKGPPPKSVKEGEGFIKAGGMFVKELLRERTDPRKSAKNQYKHAG